MEVAEFCKRARELFDESAECFTVGPLVLKDSMGEHHYIAVAPDADVEMPQAFCTALEKAHKEFFDIEEYMLGIDTWQRLPGEGKEDRVSALLIVHARLGEPSRIATVPYDLQGNMDADEIKWADDSIAFNEYIQTILETYSLELITSSRSIH